MRLSLLLLLCHLKLTYQALISAQAPSTISISSHKRVPLSMLSVYYFHLLGLVETPVVIEAMKGSVEELFGRL